MTASDPNNSAESHLNDLKKRHVPFLDLLKIRPTNAVEGITEFEMVVEEQHLRTLGIMHGGVTAALLDSAMGFAAVTMSPPGHYVVTVQLNINFVRPVWESETLIAKGEVRHSGRQTAVVFGEIHTGEGTLIATGTGTFLYQPQPGETIEKVDDAR